MRSLSFGFVYLLLFSLGAFMPVGSAATQNVSSSSTESKAKQSFSAVTLPQALGARIAQFLGGKTGQELMADKAGNVAVAGVAATQALSGSLLTQSKNDSSVKSSTARSSAVRSRAVPPPKVNASVPQIRQEIQKILDLNKKIKNVQSGSTAQFQHVQEQARIHQKILSELEASQEQSSAKKAPTKSTLLAQEKMRIIHEETQRNAKMMEGLETAPSKTVSDRTLKAKNSVS